MNRMFIGFAATVAAGPFEDGAPMSARVWPISFVRSWRLFAASVLILATLLFSSQLVLAQFTQQGPKLVGTGAVNSINGIKQGTSVAVSADGNTAVVGGDTARQPEGLYGCGQRIAQCGRYGQPWRQICGRQFANGDGYAQEHPQLCPLDPEREGGQHVTELHVPDAQRQCHPRCRFPVNGYVPHVLMPSATVNTTISRRNRATIYR
jgi:hypothetical protein